MSDGSYLEAKKQLENMFKKPTGNRHIVFWYDEPKNFEEDIKKEIDDNSFDDAKIIFYNNNPFTIKTLLEVEDTKSNYLIYLPCKRPADVENWLLDTLLYSEEYYADMVALTMRKLNLESSNLRDVISRHISFFDSQDRKNQLLKRIDLNDNTNPHELELAMMAALVKSDYAKIEYILKEIMFDTSKYDLFVKFGFDKLFWDLVGEMYFYSGEEKVDTLIKSFLITSVAENKQLSIDSPILKNLVINSSSESACYFVNEILMKDDKDRYDELQEDVGNQLKISELISSRGIDVIGSSDTFKEFDRYIINSIISSLAQGSYDYDFYLRVIDNNRLTTRWYETFKNEYSFIRSLIVFKKAIDKFNLEEGLSSEDYIQKYTDEYYEIDRLYRHVINDYSNLDDSNDIEHKIVVDVDNNYENKFLSKLGGAFSASLSKKNGEYSFGANALSKYFFKNNTNRLMKKQFVIISDALRYEVAADLLTELNKNSIFRGLAKLEHQITTLPSITSFGMASLLPNTEISYENKQVLVDGKQTNSTDVRNKVLNDKYNTFAAIQYDTVVNMTRDELRSYMADKSLVYIYHDVIDNAGEHEYNVFEACNKAIKELVDLIKKLYNTLQTSNFVITSDHGFIYRNKKIDESSKYDSFASLGLDDYSQRYAITNDDINLNYTNKFDMNYLGNCNKKVSVPYSYDLFKKQGGGIQYIHGGASLQELITPIITLSEMRGKALENKVESVKVRLKTVTRKIMNKSFSLQFEQCEKVEGKKVEANILVYFVDEDNNPISEQKVLLANKTTDNPNDRIIDMRFLLKNQEYDRNKRYFLIMKDNNTGDIISSDTQFTIDIVNFKQF